MRTVKTVIRERNNKKITKVEEKMLLYQREITQDVNGRILHDTGYPRADKDSYSHDGRADKNSYPHDGRAN